MLCRPGETSPVASSQVLASFEMCVRHTTPVTKKEVNEIQKTMLRDVDSVTIMGPF